ncbi:MAG: hypothetical protein ABI539_13485, partial [Acidobacteriota bacterium]
MQRLLQTCIVILVCVAIGAADAPNPEKRKKAEGKFVDTNLAIRIDKGTKKARLIIPASQLKQLRAELDDVVDPPNTAGIFGTSGTVFGGLLLSLAVVTGGLWFGRRSRPISSGFSKAVLLFGIFASGIFAAAVYANIGPPPEARSITGRIFSPAVHSYKQAW